MAPTAVRDAAPFVTDVADLKAKIVDNHVEIDKTPVPPVADNFMYDFKYNHSLPTIDALGTDVPADTDAAKVAEQLGAVVSSAWENNSAEDFAELFLEYGQYEHPNCRHANPADETRCLAGQARLHVGLPNLQLP